jgi:hypothetical protein
VVYQQSDAVTAAWVDGASLQPVLTFHTPPPTTPTPTPTAEDAVCWLLDGPTVVLATGGALLTATTHGGAWETRVCPADGAAVQPRVLLAGALTLTLRALSCGSSARRCGAVELAHTASSHMRGCGSVCAHATWTRGAQGAWTEMR